jgi:hypothetical protein
MVYIYNTKLHGVTSRDTVILTLTAMRTSNQYFDHLNARRRQILAMLSGELIFFIGARGEEVCIQTSGEFKLSEKLNPTYQFSQLYLKYASQRPTPT